MGGIRRHVGTGIVLVGCLGLGLLGGCGGGGGGGGTVVPTITSISGPLESLSATIFVVVGQGFGTAGAPAEALFQATNGTPFEGQTASFTSVDVQILSDTRAMGVAPLGGLNEFTATVELNLAGGATASGGGLVTFHAPFLYVPGPLDEHLTGTGNNDTISGGAGHDKIEGYGGNDDLDGGTGRDYLDGGANNDTSTGGAQGDLFVFRPELNPFVDLIVDFDAVEDALLFLDVPASPAAFLHVATVGGGGGGNDVVVAWSGGGTVTLLAPGLPAVQSLSDLVLAGVQILIKP